MNCRMCRSSSVYSSGCVGRLERLDADERIGRGHLQPLHVPLRERREIPERRSDDPAEAIVERLEIVLEKVRRATGSGREARYAFTMRATS